MFKQYIGERLVATLDLSEYIEADTAATVQIRHYGDSGVNIDIPFSLSSKVFEDNAAWDLSRQEEGIVSLPNGGFGELSFLGKRKDVDLTIKVQKHPDGSSDSRSAVLFDLNGKLAAFSVQYNNGRPWVQTMGGTGYITSWGDHYYLSAEEIAQYKTAEGIDFRVKREGAMFYLYIGDKTEPVASFDLSGSIGAEDEATVKIQHWDDAGTKIDIGFKLENRVSFRAEGYKLGKAVSLAGKTATISNDAGSVEAVIGADGAIVAGLEAGTYMVAVDGYLPGAITVGEDGTVTFGEDAAATRLTLQYKVFEDNTALDLSRQNDGVVTLPNGGSGTAIFTDKRKDVDLTIKVQKHPDGSSDSRSAILFDLNGKLAAFSVQYNNGRPWVQTMGGTGYITSWGDYYYLSAEEIAQYKTAEGIDFRVVRAGAMFYLYIGDKTEPVASFDLSGSIGAEDEATVKIQHWDDAGTKIDIGFKLENRVSFRAEGYKLGKAVSLAGKTATISNDAGSVEAVIGADGAIVAGLEAGTYTVAVDGYLAGTVTVTEAGTAEDVILVYDVFQVVAGSWDLSQQNDGKLSLSGGGTANLQFRDQMTNMDLTVKVQDHPDVEGEPRTAIFVIFENGQQIKFSVVNQGKPFVQTMDGTIYVWKSWGDLTADEVAQY